MLDITLIALSKHRLDKSREMLLAAKRDESAGDYTSANNRAYYCVFHAMRAVLALDGLDYKRHSTVIARFTTDYLKPQIIPRKYASLISNASAIRNRSDYEDFYICSVEDTRRLVVGAEDFLNCVDGFLHTRYKQSDLQE